MTCFNIMVSDITASVRINPTLFAIKVIATIIRYPEIKPIISPSKRFVKLRTGNLEIKFKILNNKEIRSKANKKYIINKMP